LAAASTEGKGLSSGTTTTGSPPQDSAAGRLAQNFQPPRSGLAKPLGAVKRLLFQRRLWALLPALLLIVVCLYYWFAIRAPHSIQAFVNTAVVAVRAPVSGKLTLSPEVSVGKVVAASEELGRIVADVENPLVSQFQLQENDLTARIANQEQQLAGVERRIAERQDLVRLYSSENNKQQQLAGKYFKAQLDTSHQDLQRTIAAAEVADAEVKRTQQLFDRGNTSRQALDRAVGAAREAAAAVSAQRARVVQFDVGLEAYNAGLQLDGPRTLSEPESRLRELRTQIVDLQEQASDLRRTIETTRAQLAGVRNELHGQHTASVRTPNAGVVWSIDGQPGENVAANAPIFQVVSCQNVWVEAFFDEADTRRLAVGHGVKVRMLYGDKAWHGTIETMRAGAGRVTVGQYVVDPPPEIARRQLPVRVITARIKVDWGNDLVPERFCFAGTSVEVVPE
jgi:multidrug resistance efflux pump